MQRIALTLVSMLLIASASAQTASESVSAFTFQMYQKVAEKEKGNIFFSPYSISSAMAMTYVGAANETQNQIASTLHFTKDTKALATSMGGLHQSLLSKNGKGLELSISNRVWVEQTYKVKCSYKRTLKKRFKTSFGKADFIGNFQSERVKINDAVATDTKSLIKDLIPQGGLSPITRLVLTNAIYFKGKWEKQFNPERTRKGDFYVDNSTTVSAQYMSSKEQYNYYEDETLMAVELPYSNDITMLVILPAEGTTISDLGKTLNQQKYQAITSELYSDEVSLMLPKFKSEASLTLSNTLKEMGMPIAFTDAADFTGISNRNDLKITDVFHKAFIEVSEEGTEAAAATAVVVGVKSMPMTRTFKANRPFIYIIRDTKTGTPLFIGRLMNPNR
ncbi:MAG: serpin family protein [Tenuifilaceae bacterium]|nr:serpin family protein [Tenuifilaceae bacterium]